MWAPVFDESPVLCYLCGCHHIILLDMNESVADKVGIHSRRGLGRAVILLCCLMLPLLASGQEKKWKRFDSILLGDVRFICPGRFIYYPFMDDDTGLIGFVRANSNLPVSVVPTYEDLYNNQEYLLIAVKKDGKWGAVDLADRWWGEDYHAPDPIIPCIYDEVWIVDDTHAKVILNGRSEIIDVSAGRLTVREFFSPEEEARRARRQK